MKTKIIAIVLAAVITVGETSCFVRVRARGPRAKVRVRADVRPVENQQQQSVVFPIDQLPNSDVAIAVSK